MQANQFCGYIAIVGRPNVGKSTLLNHLIHQKISITSKKAQTTRHAILGINTQENRQLIFVDTPGLHQNANRALNRYMNRAANSVLFDVDLILFVVDSLNWKPDDEWVLEKIKRVDPNTSVILVVNKIDKIENKEALLPHLKILNEKAKFAAVVPICAKSQPDVNMLENIIAEHLPENDFVFPEDQITDRSERFLAAEIIREKLMRGLGQELPYDLTVEIEEFASPPPEHLLRGGRVREGVSPAASTKKILRISAVIYVEKPGQKKIVIGEKGERLKDVGQKSRLDMEKLFGEKIFLKLWVKVKRGWADDEKSLQSLGFL